MPDPFVSYYLRVARKSKNNDEFLSRQLVSNKGRHPQLSANNDRIAMLWEEDIVSNEKTHTVIYYRIVKDGSVEI